uniref:Uncharacterized protein n=1 Tax=Cuerna arida TaxID=1464854 RepID=A0A1B6F6A6_9HEMI
MIALTFGALLVCQAALAYPSPYPGPKPSARPIPDPIIVDGFYNGLSGVNGVNNLYGFNVFNGFNDFNCFNGFNGLNGFAYDGFGVPGFGFAEEFITPPVVPPVLNTVDVYDIATLGVIPAPPVEYVYPAVGYEAFGLGGGFNSFSPYVGNLGYNVGCI